MRLAGRGGTGHIPMCDCVQGGAELLSWRLSLLPAELFQSLLLKILVKSAHHRHVGVDLRVDEGVVGSIPRPRPPGNPTELHEAPVQLLAGLQAEVVADRRGDINAGPVVARGLASEDVFPVVGDPGSAVFPLGVADLAAVVELDPTALADALTRWWIVAREPGDYPGGFGTVSAVVETVVVGEGHVERIETGAEGPGGKVLSCLWIRVVVSAVVLGPLAVPGGVVIGSGILY